MAHGVTGRAEAYHQRIFAVIRQHEWTLDVQRIPAGEQAVYLKTVGMNNTSVSTLVSICGISTGSVF